MAEAARRPLPTCPRCGQPYRPLAEPKRRLLRSGPPEALALCPRCRSRAAARRLMGRRT